jgi:hypothetical protein
MISHNGLERVPKLNGCSKESWTIHKKSVIQQASVKYEGCNELKFSVSFRSFKNIMIVLKGKVLAKFVPAAAVTQMGQVLFILTRRKGL